MRPIGCLVALLVAAGFAAPARSADIAVDLELVLAVDVSRSMDPAEQQLQREGYRLALRHGEVIEAIRSGPLGRVAITYVEWSGPTDQRVIVPWTLVDGQAAADAFAASIVPSATFGRLGTSISAGLAFSAGLLEGNGFVGERRVIDVSGDGPNNMGPPVELARDAVLKRGITVNGLPIVLRPGVGMSHFDIADLDRYYRDCVVGGPGAFTIPVTSTSEFETAIRRKLILEIARRDEPEARIIRIADGPPPIKTDCLIGELLRQQWLR